MNAELTQQSDEVLVRNAVIGDRTAFDELVRRYCRPLSEFVSSRTSTLQDAEDIVQETFLRAYLNLRSFKAQYSLKNWLFTIAYRLVISAYRKKKPVRLSDEAAFSMAASPESTTPQNNWIWNMVGRMSEDDHDVLWLRYKQQMSIDEIAGVIGRTKATVRVRLHRARNRLAKQVNASKDQSIAWGSCEVV